MTLPVPNPKYVGITFSKEANVHPEVERVFRNLFGASYDAQKAAGQLAAQIEGGAMASATMAAGAVTAAAATAPGYYLTPPTATIEGDGTGAQVQVVTRSRVVNGVTVFRVSGLTVTSGGSGYTTADVVFSS